MAQKKIGRYRVDITNADFILFPKSNITKGELVDYYERIAPMMLKYITDRPITMHRFPEGINTEGFYHKNVPDYFPDWIERCPIEKEDGGIVNYAIINNAASLVYIANQGCITPHMFLSTTKKIDCPDQIIFDLDPPAQNFDLARTTALKLHDLLVELGLVPFVKTTGSRGFHVVVPIKPVLDFDQARKRAHAIAHMLVERDPKNLTLEVRKAARRGKLYVDVMRNAWAQTAVAPYAVRPHERAPVATPLEWDELKSRSLRSNHYTIKTIFKRLAQIDDPWKSMKKYARKLPKL